MVYINQNASNLFLPDLIGSAIFIVLTIMSLMIKKSLAAIASHITRGLMNLEIIKSLHLEDKQQVFNENTNHYLEPR